MCARIVIATMTATTTTTATATGSGENEGTTSAEGEGGKKRGLRKRAAEDTEMEAARKKAKRMLGGASPCVFML